MRRILTLGALVAVFSALALAESWTGRLVDASCIDRQSQTPQSSQRGATCNPTDATTAFALQVSGKNYKLDSNGNQKAQDALKNRADRMKDNPPMQSSRIMAKITGTMEGDTLNVDTIDVQ